MKDEWNVINLDHLETLTETFFTNTTDEIDENCTFSEPIGKKGKKKNFNNNDLSKYWNQRYSYFSLFDQGVLVDSEGWYSVTPEAIANKIACNIPPGSIVIDAFAGIGGNSIAFARQKSAIVYAVEIDAQRIKLAKNNAKVYGVSEKIKFIRADFFSLIPKFAKKFSKILKKGVEQPQIWIFLSPPWGGPNYQQKDIYRLSDMNMSDFDGFDLFKQVQNISKNVIYYLPKNVSVADLFKLAQAENHSYDQFTVEQHWLNDRFKVLAAYYTDQGNFEIKT